MKSANSIQPSILHGLGDVGSDDRVAVRKIGDRARDFEHAMVRASGKIKAIDRALEEFLALPVGHAELIHLLRYLVRGAAALAARMPKVAARTGFCCLFATGAGAP